MRAAVRGWLIRGLILAGVAALAGLGWVANSWVSPERVREQVLAALADHFDGVDAHVGSARLRILGGIAVRDLKLVRRGDPPDRPFLVVPAAVLYHDKEQLNRGRLVIRKIELDAPTVHLVRAADGRWNVADVLRPAPADRPVPTFVATGAAVTVTDHAPDALPPLRLADTRLTLLNDPLPVLVVEAQGAAETFGPAKAKLVYNRITRHAKIALDLPGLPLGDLAPALAARFAPAAAEHLTKLTAAAAVKAELHFAPDAAPAWRHDVQVVVKDGRLDHPDVPWPVEKIGVKVRSIDGRVKIEDATAKVGPATVKVALDVRGETPTAAGPAADDDPLAKVEEHLQRADVTVAGVPLDDALFERLGQKGATLKRMFAPTGTVDVGYRFARDAAAWKREVEVRPRGITGTYEKFRYPVTGVEGTVRRTTAPGAPPTLAIDVRGRAAGETVTVKGQVYGDGPDPAINLRVAGSNIPIDEAVISALPDRYPDILRQFRPAGRATFTADITQKLGVNLAENEFRIEVADGSMTYQLFPYRLDKVKGKVIVRVAAVEPRAGAAPPPDRDELVLDGFTGTHGPGTVWLHGTRRPVPGTPDRKLELHVGGTGCPVDADLAAALAALKLDDVHTCLSPRGTLTFAADVEVQDRGPRPVPGGPPAAPAFNPATDLSLTFNFYGPTVTPAFFKYELTDLAGWLQYRAGRVDLAHLAARHGESRLKLEAGEVRFYPRGVVWANLGKLEVRNVVADEALLAAVPAAVRDGVAGLKLRGRADLELKHLVVLTPPDAPPEPAPVRAGVAAPVARAQAPAAQSPASPPPPPDPVVYWDAELRLLGAAVDTGVAWDDLYGAVACRGRYEGTHLGLVRGNLWLDRAVIARQPLTAVQGQVVVRPQAPDPARPGFYQPPTAEVVNLTGNMFHGTVGGEARVVLADPPRYDLWLTATDVQLEEVARHYRLAPDAELRGIAQAQVRLFNRFDPRAGAWVVEGTGRMDVPTGRMYNLPILLDLVKVLKLQAPDRTAFEEAHAAFRLKGDRVTVDQLDLIGKAVCVGGSGELDTAGDNVRLEFYSLGSQLLARLANTPVGDLSAFLSRNLFVIRMTKENGGEIRYRPEPVPLVTDPARAVVERLRRLREGRPETRGQRTEDR
jgi:hypothetical protein